MLESWIVKCPECDEPCKPFAAGFDEENDMFFEYKCWGCKEEWIVLLYQDLEVSAIGEKMQPYRLIELMASDPKLLSFTEDNSAAQGVRIFKLVFSNESINS